MAVTQIVPPLSVAEYLEMERDADLRHEYVDGEIFFMVGASLAHNLIAGNLFGALHQHLLNSPCRVFMNDMKVHIKTANAFYYPDLMVVCEKFEQQQDTYFQTHARIIIEILSKSTQARDRMEKRLNYQTLPELQEYVLVAQEQKAVELYARSDDNWSMTHFTEDTDIRFNSIDFQLSIDEIYRDVVFAK